MESDLEMWLTGKGELFLKEIGIKEGWKILDFGCGDGTYSIPAAKLVGKKGRVYVADKDKKAVNSLLDAAKSKGIENIEGIEITKGPKIDIEDSIDASLLYDVLHYMDEKERKNLYSEIYRILKPGGILSVYPKHNKSDWPLWNLSDMDIEDIVKEIENSGFYFEGNYRKMLIHNGEYEMGTVLNFRKGETINDEKHIIRGGHR